jgi:hypothetical protein
MTAARVKFSSQAPRKILSGLRRLAKDEGRQFQSVLEEAMQEYLERHSGVIPRRRVIEAFQQSLNEFDSLYDKLAK